MRPYAKETVYVNYVDAGEDARFEAAYGANYERLAALEDQVRPGQLLPPQSQHSARDNL